MTSTPPLTVFYNSACPVCKSGIESQRAAMTERSARGDPHWVDIACNADVLNHHNLDVETVRHSLHVYDGEQMHVGADAFIALARVTPGQRWLAELFGNPVLRPIARIVYNRFADILYWWNRNRGRW